MSQTISYAIVLGMVDISDNNITIRMFAGFLLTSEMRMHLNRSLRWKRSSFEHDEKLFLSQTHHEGHDYIGLYLEEEVLPLARIGQVEKTLRDLLHEYCAELPPGNRPITLFPQIFIR